MAAVLLATACGGGGGGGVSGLIKDRTPSPPLASSSQPRDEAASDFKDSSASAPIKAEPTAKKQDPPGNQPPAETQDQDKTTTTPSSNPPVETETPSESGLPAEDDDPPENEPIVAERSDETQDQPDNEPSDETQEPLEAEKPAEEPPAKGPPGNQPPAKTQDQDKTITTPAPNPPVETETPAEPGSPAEDDDPPENEPIVAEPSDETQDQPENEPSDETQEPLEAENPAEEPPADGSRVVEIAGARIMPIQLPAKASGQIEFKPDSFAKIPGRLELVDELERCLAASGSGCRKATNWLFLGEYGVKHREVVSLAIQSGAGREPENGGFPADITYFHAGGILDITHAIQDGTIPQGAWINWSRGSGFGPPHGFNVPQLTNHSVVVAIATGNKGIKYKQTYPGPNANSWLKTAIRNSVVIFVYGLNREADDIYGGSNYCGNKLKTVCIGVRDSSFVTDENNRRRQVGGTSFATGVLSGTAWLMKSIWPHLTSQQIAKIMLETAKPLHDGDAPADVRTGVGALDFTALFQPVGPLTAKELGADDLVLERGFLHLPGLTDFDNPEGVDRFARSFQLATSTLAIQPGFADFDLGGFTPAGPGSRLHLAVRKRTAGVEDAALAFGHTNKLVLSSRYIGLCRDGQNTDLCLTTTRREDFFGGQGSGSFRLEDTTYTSFAATHQMPLKDRLELGFSATVTEARTSGRHLVGDVEGRLLQTEISLRNKKDTKSRKTSTSISVWGSKFDGSMDMRGKQSPLHERSAGVRLLWKLEF